VARAFLDGTDDAPLLGLQRAMMDASDALEFERAASLRDKLQRLETLRLQFDRMRFAVESLTFAYHVPGIGGDDRVYLVRRGRVRDELTAPTESHLQHAAAQIFSAPGFDRGAVPSHEVDELMLLTWWFTKFPNELARTSSPSAIAPAAVA
jgi:excinuclease ABC subunit C